MKITYTNYVPKRSNKPVPFLAEQPITPNEYKDVIAFGFSEQPNELTEFTFYDSTENPRFGTPIYIELANADTLEKAMAFTCKYGALINPRLIPKSQPTGRTYHLVHSLKTVEIQTENTPRLFDCTRYIHFRCYQLIMKDVLTFLNLLNTFDSSSSSKEAYVQHILTLFNTCTHCFDKSVYEPLFYIEYDEIPFYEKNPDFFGYNDFFKYLHQTNCIPSIPGNTKDSGSSYSAENFADFPISSLQEIARIAQSGNLITFNINELVELAKYLFSSILSFFLRDVRPIVNYSDAPLDFSWRFNSLADAIFYCLYLDHHFGVSKISVCANEKCNNLLFTSKSTPRKKYCCPECAHRVASRKYKRNHPNK